VVDLKNLPDSPGVYIYRNTKGEIIYVGKAINLKKRVSQYFQRDDALGPKTKTLVSQIDSVETRVVNSEIEALILEASLIKKHLPKYNSLLRDDRSYLYIVITKDKFPLVYPTHASSLPPHADIFGPFPSGRDVQTLLKTIRRIFPYFGKKHGPNPCLFCHLNLCPGPDISEIKYRQTLKKIKQILNGKFSLLRRNLVKEMKLFSSSENYENAQSLKKQINSLDYIVSGWRSLSTLFSTIELSTDRQSQSLSELTTTLSPYLKIKKLKRIECFDISQLGNRYFVGSMSVALNGKPENSQYRQFKIRSRFTPDDQLMIKEVLWRRLRHPEWGTPNLLIVDGGKPQVSSAATITKLPLIGLAKKMETIVIKKGINWQEINLPPSSSALHLLQSLRNEAHRFANRYRRLLIKKELL
jgi:excinuclease ABC subunit C